MNDINQEYVNLNIDKIIEFMKMCEPEKARKNSRNWRYTLLKDYKTKIHILVCYQKYTECENIKNHYEDRKKIYEDRIDKFYDKERELDERINREGTMLRNLEEQIGTWRNITKKISCKLRETISARDYMGFVSEFPSYYGL